MKALLQRPCLLLIPLVKSMSLHVHTYISAYTHTYTHTHTHTHTHNRVNKLYAHRLTALQKLLVLRALRPERATQSSILFVTNVLGRKKRK